MSTPTTESETNDHRYGPVRYGLRVRGTVQGVGFRPAVYRLATTMALAGLVRNDAEGVWIEIEGEPDAVDGFTEAVAGVAPPRARIDVVERRRLAPLGEAAFRITASSDGAHARARLPADAAPCDECVRELGDPGSRRYRYAFTNCTACGPRYSIVADLPYDRARTTMAGFVLCTRCRREYEDPADRRFHAEPNACPACGPRLRLLAPDGALLTRSGIAGDPLAAAARALRAGRIVALKGVGGFLLAVDARDEDAVARLRVRKQRPHKPLALMARDLGEVTRIARLGDAARAALVDAARPIVLLRARHDGGVAPSVAPGLAELGVMLPATPLHQLLLEEGPPLVVMTSGNRRDEPLAADDAQALERLAGIADLFVTHDRPIHTRIDDSVLRIVAGGAQPIRRARGFVPEAIALPVAGSPLLAVGAQQKSTVCLTRGGEAFVSQHLGDLANPSALAWFEETIAKLQRLVGVEPTCVAHDLHPDYRSTQWATQWARARAGATLGVQHHHAHVAACLAEHGRTGPTIGVAFDGTGCGPDGELWGGELLVADLAGFERIGHLRPLALPGGEAAIRQPWRLALAALLDAGAPTTLVERIDPARRAAVERLLASGIAAPRATGAGRWFDAVAALIGLRDEISYDAQAAVELEAHATIDGVSPYPFTIAESAPRSFEVDLRPTVRAIAAALLVCEPTATIASRFHETMAHVIVAGASRARALARVETVALSGGCFCNVRLTERARELLTRAGFEVLIHRRVPPNDGGLSFGQAAVASFHSWREATHVSGNSR